MSEYYLHSRNFEKATFTYTKQSQKLVWTQLNFPYSQYEPTAIFTKLQK